MDISEAINNVQNNIDVKRNLTILLDQYEGLIKKLCHKYSCAADFEELYQEGFLALYRAAVGYDQTKGANFTTYFYSVLNTSLHVYTSGQTAVSIPDNLAAEAGRYSAFLRDFKGLYDREPTKRERKAFISGVLKEDPRAITRIEKAIEAKSVKSLNEPVTEDGGTLCDILADKNNMYDDTMREYDRQILRADVKEAIEKLEDRQKSVIVDRYYKGMTLDAIGAKMGISRERARQLMQNGFRRVRNTDYKKKLKGYYDVYLSAATCRHVGVNQFNRTWTSEQEYYVLRQERQEARERRREREAWLAAFDVDPVRASEILEARRAQVGTAAGR